MGTAMNGINQAFRQSISTMGADVLNVGRFPWMSFEDWRLYRNRKEISLADARARLQQNPRAVLLDVREDNEWQAGHAVKAAHLGKGIFERDLEARFPDPNTELIMYCGGGYRSALTADAARQMGYAKVFSLIGGYKGMVAAQWPMTKAG